LSASFFVLLSHLDQIRPIKLAVHLPRVELNIEVQILLVPLRNLMLVALYHFPEGLVVLGIELILKVEVPDLGLLGGADFSEVVEFVGHGGHLLADVELLRHLGQMYLRRRIFGNKAMEKVSIEEDPRFMYVLVMKGEEEN